MKTLTIRVSDEEHALMVAAAAKRFMSITSMVRAHFHSICEQDGTLKSQTTNAEPNKPQVIRVHIPTEPNAWREEILRRHKGGELLTSIADSYGMPLAVVRSKLHDAKTAELEGASLNLEELPEYNPADPDNPTLAEQKINADRARAQLEKLGFNV